MIEKKDLLISYLSWLLCFLICMAVGIYRTYALTFTNFQNVQNSTQLLVEYRTGAQPIDWPYNNSGLYQSDVVRINYIVSNVSISANVHYEFESHMLSQRIIGSPTYTITGLNGESCLTNSYYLNFINSEYPRWDFQCPHATSTFTLTIYQPNNSNLFNSGTMGWGSAILSQTDVQISSTNNDTEEIINNQNKNTNDIIDNINSNLTNCRDSINLFNKNVYFNLNGASVTLLDTGVKITQATSGTYKYDYAILDNGSFLGKTITLSAKINSSSNNKPLIRLFFGSSGNPAMQSITSLTSSGSTTVTIPSTFPSNSDKILIFFYSNVDGTGNVGDYVDYTDVQVQIGSSSTKYEPFGETVCVSKIDSINDSLNNDDTSGATNEASDFFSSFSTNTFGLTSIITAPLTLIQSIASQSCSSLHLPLPYLNNKYLDLPCMSTIYSTYFGTFFTLYQTITYGIIAYWVCVRIFNQVKDFKNPEHDEIEVLDL